MSHSDIPWWKAPKGEVFRYVLEEVQRIEREQFETFNRFERLAYLYDPNDPSIEGKGDRRAKLSENVVATNVDTAHAEIAATEIRARHHTDDGDWSMQRRARHLDWYGEGLDKMLGHDKLATRAFLSLAKKGTGLVKVHLDGKEIRSEHVLVNNIVVDDAQCLFGGKPRDMHERVMVDREELISKYPDHEDHIRSSENSESATKWAGYRPVPKTHIVLVESWLKATPYRKGRHTKCISGLDLLDEEWEDDFFPFAIGRWSERDQSFYGISLSERIEGHQMVIDKSNWQEDKIIDKFAHPTTYVRMADAKLAVQTRNRVGDIVPIKGDMPTTVVPRAVPIEIQNRRAYAKESAYNETGVSRMAATGSKPAGLDSGVALREYKDQRGGRFAHQEKEHERLRLQCTWLALRWAKKLGDDAPVIVRRSKLGPRKIKWSDVDMTEVRVQMSASSTLPRSSAGRTQMFLEAAQAGVITQDEARRMFDPHSPLDMEHDISLFTAALENCEETIEAVLDGEVVVPNGMQNLPMLQWRAQMAYLRADDNGAPEEVLEGLQTLITQTAWELSLLEQPQMPANDNMGAEMLPAPVPGVEPAGAAPMGPAPAAALAPEAMNLVAQ